MPKIRSIFSKQQKKGRFYFSRQTERKFFFIATLVMLVTGIIVKIGGING